MQPWSRLVPRNHIQWHCQHSRRPSDRRDQHRHVVPIAGLDPSDHSKSSGRWHRDDHSAERRRHVIREQICNRHVRPNINNVNYLVQGNVRNAPGFVSFNGAALGGCNILTYNAAGALTDIASGCHVMIFRMP